MMFRANDARDKIISKAPKLGSHEFDQRNDLQALYSDLAIAQALGIHGAGFDRGF